MARRRGILSEFILFFREHRNYWLIPLVAVLLLFLALIVLGGTGAAPFIYTLF